MRFYFKALSILIAVVLSIIILSSFWSDFFKKAVNNRETRNSPLTVKNEDYNVWCTFTKVRAHRTIKDKLQTLLISLLNNTSSVITLNLITDSLSRFVARDVIYNARNITGKDFKVAFHDVNRIANKIDDTVALMRQYFSSQPGAYYSDSLFFVSLVLHKIAINQHKVVLIDVDTYLKTDIVELFNEFNKFSNSSLIGIAPELSPVYHHILYRFRQQNKGTKLGMPLSEGGFPGVNSGVLILDLDRLRASPVYEKLLSKEALENLTKKYSFKGHLGDQDFYTLIGLEHRELLHLMDCSWNRQLCRWWSQHGYAETFDKFFACPSQVKIYHGNCNTHIPKN